MVPTKLSYRPWKLTKGMGVLEVSIDIGVTTVTFRECSVLTLVKEASSGFNEFAFLGSV